MYRYLRMPWFVPLFTVACGLGCYFWQRYDLGRSCGYAPGFGLPSFPYGTAAGVLIASPTLLVGVSALIQRRSARTVAALMALTAVLATIAVGIAIFWFLASRNCFS